MKKTKLLFFGLAMFTAFTVDAQPIFSENFNGTNPLANWTLFNQDGLTPATNVNYVTDAWVIREDFDTTGVNDNVAVSTSWYTPAGTANDYLVSPAIAVTTNNFLFYDVKAQDAQFPDGYELLVSTTTPTVAAFQTTLFSTNGENATWTRRSIDLSSYSGQTIYLAWRNNSNDQFLLLVDNVLVSQVSANDATISELTVGNVQTDGSSFSVTGSLRNMGTANLSSVDINWSTDGGTTVNTDNVTPGIASFASSTFTHSMQVTASNPGNYTDLMVWTSQPNGMADAAPAGDTMRVRIFVNNGSGIQRKVLLEEFTTAPCPWCPDGTVVVEQILNSNPNVIGVGVHACFSTDAMTITAASDYCTAFGSGAPTATVDRFLFPGEANVAFGRGGGAWGTRASQRANITSPVRLNMTGTYDSTARSVSVDVDARFVDYALPGDIRVTVMVVEDSVTGTGPGYDQRNNYNSGQVDPNHPFVGAGDPIVGFVHRHVLRAVYPAGNSWGDSTVIPSSPALNAQYSKNYRFTLNNAWDADKVTLVAVVSYFNADVGQREVLNAFDVKLDDTFTGIDDAISENISSLSVSPNPATNITNIDLGLLKASNVNLSVYDMTGKKVMGNNYGKMLQGTQRISLNVDDLSDGFYFINLNVDGEMISRKIAVSK